jgi:hypothetical protein
MSTIRTLVHVTKGTKWFAMLAIALATYGTLSNPGAGKVMDIGNQAAAAPATAGVQNLSGEKGSMPILEKDTDLGDAKAFQPILSK